MLKKLIAFTMIAVLALTCTAALAATYVGHDRDIVFDYDDTKFAIEMDDHTDDEDLVILAGKD